MTRYGTAATALGAAVLLAACSGGSRGGHSSDSPTPTTASASPSASQTGGLSAAIDEDLSNRLLRKAEWPAVTGVTATQFFTPAEAAALHPDPTTEGQRLTAEGLVALAVEQLVLPGGSGLASVTRFRTPAGAKAEAAHATSAPGTRRLAVASIPGASGFEVVQNGAVVARNVAFVAGAYIYTVGSGGTGTTVAQLTAVARTWYARVSKV